MGFVAAEMEVSNSGDFKGSTLHQAQFSAHGQRVKENTFIYRIWILSVCY